MIIIGMLYLDVDHALRSRVAATALHPFSVPKGLNRVHFKDIVHLGFIIVTIAQKFPTAKTILVAVSVLSRIYALGVLQIVLA